MRAKAIKNPNTKLKLLTILLIAISGNTVILEMGGKYLFIICFLIFASFQLKRSTNYNTNHLYLIFAFLLITVIHTLQFGTSVILSSSNFILKLAIASLSITLIPLIGYYYVKTMVFLSVMSLVFYIPMQVGIDLASILSSFDFLPEQTVTHIGIHNFHIPREYARNSGMFWEPGAFAGYLIIAFLFLLSKNIQIKKRELFLITVALITTFSTTSYIALFVIILINIIKTNMIKPKMKLIAVPILMLTFLAFSYAIYNSSEFLNSKITDQMNAAIEQSDNYETTRIGSLLYDLESIRKYPLLGASQVISNREADIDEKLVGGQGNGLSGFAVRYGITGLGVFLFFSYLSFKKMYQDRKLAIGATFIIMIILSGEQFLNYPLIMVLLFLGITKK